VCCILGFMLTYQFKLINSQGKTDSQVNNADITVQIEQLTKQKQELTDKVNSLESKVSDYEKNAVNNNNLDKALYDELNTDRMMVGSLPVKGEGVIFYINPVGDFLNTNQDQPVTAEDLVYTVNYMFSAGAEAVSINDIRVVSRTGIKASSGGLIKIGTDFVNSYKQIVIRAIGDKDKMNGALNSWLPIQPTSLRTIKTEKSDSITIPKINKEWKFDFAKPVESK
jgi:uncharacterized protein YlxW (UPF0749 family)